MYRIILLIGESAAQRYARFMLRVLTWREVAHHFQVVSTYIRTGNNTFSDDLIRLPLEEARAALAAK